MDYGVQNIKSGDLNSNTLYITENTAYNVGDIGNYIWGSGMVELGIGLDLARTGAHYNNLINGQNQKTSGYDFGPGTYGSICLLDSPAGKAIFNKRFEQVMNKAGNGLFEPNQ